MLTPDQLDRYDRNTRLPEIGIEGQQKLLAARVVVVGAGGLGSPVLYYLAAAGVGTLGVVDGDLLERSNLQRQILHRDDRTGMLKTESAALTLTGLNPDVTVVPHAERITPANAQRILQPYDVIVTACDNFPTRYVLNDAAYLLDKPLVDGSVFRFEGMATVYLPGRGCYRCLFPAPSPQELVARGPVAGPLGVVPGLIGLVQATETLKLLLGVGDSMVGRLLAFDALAMEFRELAVQRDPDCPLCGDHPTITELREAGRLAES